MKKLSLALFLTVISTVFAFAQSDIKKSEFYVGYSNNRVDTGNAASNSTATLTNFYDNRTSFNGFEVAAVGNVHRYIGIKGDFSAAYRDKDFNNLTVTNGSFSTSFNVQTKNSLYNFLGGVQVKDNSSASKVKPFAHALVGVGYGKTELRCGTSANTVCSSGFNSDNSRTGFAAAIGGGLDVKVGDRFGIRVIQFDYNPVRFDGQTLNNYRIGAGITF